LGLLPDDPVNKPALLAYLDGAGPWAELRTIVRALAMRIRPERYLEIGVRLGWSLAQVMEECPACYIAACDMWVPGYGGADNPGALWVRQECYKAVPQFRGTLVFVDGPSQKWLPMFIEGKEFDLISVDGDHSGLGAWQDLAMCLPKVAPGGALVFDDLVDASDEGMTLREAWEQAKRTFDGFEWYEFAGLVPVGVAVKHD